MLSKKYTKDVAPSPYNHNGTGKNRKQTSNSSTKNTVRLHFSVVFTNIISQFNYEYT